jgi:antitoxin (DNA-binding transcriptional repressor) of toxin-antitoxin stability system
MASNASRPQAVGCRELKTRMGSYLRRVKAGATFIVTERGQPIAELRPLALGGGIEEQLYRLASQGLVSREVREPAAFDDFQPLVSRQSVSQAVLDDREDRF